MAAMMLFPLPVLADSVTTNTANVPIQESYNSPRVVSFIPNNISLEKSSEINGYYNIKYNGISGYISKEYTVEGLEEKNNSDDVSYINYTTDLDANSTFAQVASERKRYFRDYKYTYGYNALVPANYKRSRQVDCSGFVSDVIYHYGKLKNNSSLMSIGRKTSVYFNGIGKKLANGGTNKNFALVSFANLAPGDILCYDGHVEIYAGRVKGTNKLRVWNCGDTKYIRSNSLITPASNTVAEITYILRVK